MQRLALFDLDNTLIDLDAAFRAWAQEFVDTRGLGPAAVADLIALGSRHPHRDAFFGRVRESFELDDAAADLWGEYRKRMPYLVRCRPEVLDGLAALRAARWKVAIVTNGTADNQLGKIRQTRLENAVDAYAVSGIEGIRKPEQRLFEIASRRCGLSLDMGGWMVGDNLVADIAGGQTVGLRTIWIDRGTWPGQEHEADHVVTDVAQAIEILLAH
ncbi:HAD family hydrolase [Nonomuraea sp. NPDC050536]|uniref:HAD family hydrolase n=1 Tax=Nonomuraea sp. NPDC050536 TaxID=3364366 RepID=UPI0037CA90B4